MYTQFYGFSHKPFELTPNPDVIYLSETHQEALSVLLYGVYNRKGFLQVSGDVGSGKSTLVQALISKLAKNIHLCHIPNPNFTIHEFYYYLSAKFGLDEFDGNRAKFILKLAEFIKQCRERDEFVLLIIDEAQVLSLELLEEIRLLSNQEYTEFGVLSIFFVGQPELNVLLKHKKMDPLRNRIGIRFNLEPLTLDETVAYIQFRLKKAGRTVLLFSQKAFQKIHESSGGIPRSINILCDNALLEGFAEQRGVIDENIIIQCIKELEQLDGESLPAENEPINITKEATPVSRNPVIKEVAKDKNKKKPNSFRKYLSFVLIILCALFFTLMYTTEYWGRFPQTYPAKVWFEKIKIDESFFDKLKELLNTVQSGAEVNVVKSDTKLNSAKINTKPEKVVVSSGHQEEKNNYQNNPVVIKTSITEPAIKNLSKDDAFTEAITTKQKTVETNFASNTNQAGSGATLANLIGTDTAAKKLAINKNPDGTSSLTITRQVESKPAITKFLQDDAVPETIKSEQNSGGTSYVSIISIVGGANIRSGPSMSENVLIAVPPGYPLRVIDQQGDWVLVENFKNRKGWVANSLIIGNYTVIIMSDTVNLLKGPSHQDKIVAKIDYGTIMQVEERQNLWLRVRSKEGVVGWIDKDMVWP